LAEHPVLGPQRTLAELTWRRGGEKATGQPAAGSAGCPVCPSARAGRPSRQAVQQLFSSAWVPTARALADLDEELSCRHDSEKAFAFFPLPCGAGVLSGDLDAQLRGGRIQRRVHKAEPLSHIDGLTGTPTGGQRGRQRGGSRTLVSKYPQRAGGPSSPGMVIEEGKQVRLAPGRPLARAARRRSKLARPGRHRTAKAWGGRPSGRVVSSSDRNAALAACARRGPAARCPPDSSSTARRCGRASPFSARGPAQ